MFLWNSLAVLMIQQMLVIWSLVPLLFLNPAWTSGSSWFRYCWSLAWKILSITFLACEMSALVCVCVCVVCIYIHSSVCEHLGCFHVLAIVNSAVMNLGGHVCFQIKFMSVYMLRSGVTGSCGHSPLSFLRNLHTVLHSDCTISHLHQQRRRVPCYPHLRQHLLFVDSLMMPVLTI